MRAVYSGLDRMDVELVRILLSQHGIECSLDNEFGNQLGQGFQAPLIPLVLSVEEARADQALELIRRRAAERAPSPVRFVLTACGACGRTLEMPAGEDPPEECPWCGRSPAAGS